jgi:hypothetical protein
LFISLLSLNPFSLSPAYPHQTSEQIGPGRRGNGENVKLQEIWKPVEDDADFIKE